MALNAKKKGKSSQASRKTGTKWLIALDPFEEGVGKFLAWVRRLSEQSDAQLEGVYVLAPSSMNWNGAFSGPWVKRYAPLADAKMQELLPDTKSSVIVCREAGMRAAASTLVKYAEKNKVDCIAIATHGRSGLERLALGSFAETVIQMSKIPVLVFNPHNKTPREVHKILVPTDLSKQSEKYVKSMADYAKAIGAELVLFHKQPDPLDPLVQQGVYSLGGGWVSVQSFIDEDIEHKNQQIADLEEQLRKKDVAVSHVFDTSPAGLVEAIDKAAQDSGADLVSVLTQSGPWTAAILGSVARGLVRNSSIPVLVQR